MYTKYLLEDSFNKTNPYGDYNDVFKLFQKTWKKDCTNGLDAEFCASLRVDMLERFIYRLIDILEYNRPKINKSLIQYIMNIFMLHENVTNKQIEYMLQNNHLWATSIAQLRDSQRFNDLPEHLKSIISNKIKEMNND